MRTLTIPCRFPLRNHQYVATESRQMGLTRKPRLPIRETLPHIFHLELLAACTELHVCLQATNHPNTCRPIVTPQPVTRDEHHDLRSVSLRNLAVSGKSDKMKNEAMAQRTVTSPSRMKIHAHPGFPPTPSILWIAAARSPPASKIVLLISHI